MVGGGIFAVTGLTIEVTRGAAPIAFVIAGIVALLISYSYRRLTLQFPGIDHTVCAGGGKSRYEQPPVDIVRDGNAIFCNSTGLSPVPAAAGLSPWALLAGMAIHG
jgi:hypothetical protein